MARSVTHAVTKRSPIRRRLWTPTHAAKVVSSVATGVGMAPVTRNEYFRQLIDLIGAKHGDHNAHSLVSWAVAEGGSAWFNPLNTTRYKVGDGSWDYNWVHVRSFPTLSAGLSATAATLKQTGGVGDFSAILAHLRAGDPARRTLEAVENSNWGTGGLALRVLPQVQSDYYRWANVHVSPT